MNEFFDGSQTPSALAALLRRRPQALARISGSGDYPRLSGVVRFYQTGAGVLLLAEIRGLPEGEGPCGQRIFGFHIHEGERCGGNAEDPFADAKGHYNPEGCAHPDHAGDLPPLFGNHGFALQMVLTQRFSLEEVLGKTVIIHGHPDDLTTQPAGGAGTKIACGVIRCCG